MLPAAARLTDGQDFRSVVRRGRRAGRKRLVGYLLVGDACEVRVGFIVSKAVGNSVVRHRVARRLRHLMRERLSVLAPGGVVVIRALAPAADASSAELARDLDAVLAALRGDRARLAGQR